MKPKEWMRLFLLFVATNGWWAFATFPKLDDKLSPLIMAGFFPTIVMLLWFLVWFFENVGKE